MQKPNNFDNVQVGGDFTPVELGGHHMVIKQVAERQSSTGKPMLVVLFDFAKNDRQPEYFSDLFRSDVRPDKKWPNNGTNYIVSVDASGQCSKSFKSFIKAVEDSNQGFVTAWGDGPQFTAQFKNKRIGGVFGNVEDEYNGERKMRRKLRWFCRDEAADNANIPQDKYIDDRPARQGVVNEGFMSIPDTDEEAIPF